jgi:hypothetical protein
MRILPLSPHLPEFAWSATILLMQMPDRELEEQPTAPVIQPLVMVLVAVQLHYR